MGMARVFGLIVIGMAILTALVFVEGRITDWKSEHDAYQNLQQSFRVANWIWQRPHVVESRKSNEGFGNYREPLPVLALALNIVAHSKLSTVATAEEMNRGEPLVTLKHHNLIWAAALLFGAVFLVLGITGLNLAGVGGAIGAITLVTSDFLVKTSIIDRFYTEIQAATLLVWLTVALMQAVRTRAWIWFIVAGALCGALALTKAMFLYVGIVVPLVMAIVCLLPPARWRLRSAAPRFAAMAVAMVVIVGPWLAHNYLKYGVFEIAQRGGEILMMRAKQDHMTTEEARGALYTWASELVQEPIGRYLGFSQADLSKGGRLERLNIHGDKAFVAEDWAAEIAGRPQDALTYYTEARAERVKLLQEMRAAGRPNPRHSADTELRNRALSIIASDLGTHLRMTPLFLWRGLWARSPTNLLTVSVYLAMVLGFFIVGIVGLLRRDPVITALTLPAIGIVSFFSLFTQFHPRFSDIVLPLVYVCAAAAVAWTLRRIRLRMDRAPEPAQPD